jgi:hypothetical protein
VLGQNESRMAKVGYRAGWKAYVRPVLRLTPARKAETRTASKAKWVRRPSWVVVLVEVMREGSRVGSVAHHHDGCVVVLVGMRWVGGVLL